MNTKIEHLNEDEILIRENRIKEELKQAANELKKIKKFRSDKGQKRLSYTVGTSKAFNSYLKRANVKGFEFELTDEMFTQLKYCQCTYCGSSSPSGFDRVDSSIGYTIENSTPCCVKCNMMKYKHSQEDFIAHIKKIAKHI